MKSSFLFCLSLILLVTGIACSGVSSGNSTAPAVQDEAAGSGSDRPEQVLESGAITDEGSNPDAAAVELPLSFKVARVLELEQREGGQSESGPSVEERLQASTLDFLADGTFTYDTSRGVSTLYPVQGEYQLEGRILVFSGSRSHSYGPTGDASVNIEGEVDLNGDAPVASVLVEEKSTTVTNDYGGTLSTDKTSTYSSTLLLEPVQ
jgi:hypothetical protein